MGEAGYYCDLEEYICNNFSTGIVIEYVPNGTAHCTSWILLPAENLWPRWLRGILYLAAMAYIFVGIAIISDVFMCSIEVITSKQKTVYKWDPEKRKTVKKDVLVWNETIANLTLMALGSSAPEILLNVGEALKNLSNFSDEDSLGTFTIIGSASFNLLIITAVCVTSVKSYETKRIKDFGVFMLTSVWSIFAYVWVYFVVIVHSPGTVDIGEAWITLGFFPLLVLSAYCQDHGWWVKIWWRFSKGRPVISSEPPSTDNINGSHMNVRVVNGIGRRHSILHAPSPQLRMLEAEKTSSQQNLRIITESEKITQPHFGGHSQINRVHDEERQQHARARSTILRSRFRHAAVRSLLGGKKRHVMQRGSQVNGSTPRLIALVDKVKSLDLKEPPITEDLKGKFTFASPHYSVLESAGKVEVEVLLHRSALSSNGANTSLMENGKGHQKSEKNNHVEEAAGTVTGVFHVCFETRDGTAKRDFDYTFKQDKLTFLESECRKTVSIPITKSNTFTSNVEFYVILKSPDGGSPQLGEPSVTRVTIIDDNIPGEFSFDKSHYTIDKERNTVTATVRRMKGSDGTVTLQYTTIDGSAIGGHVMGDSVDYKSSSGILCFKHQEISKSVVVEVNKHSEKAKNFVICLRNPSVGASLGENSAAVVSFTADDLGDRVAYILNDDDEEDESWGDQIRNAMTVGGDIDEDGMPIKPAAIDCIMHFVAFFWKVLFSLIPPKHVWGGWPAFVLSIVFIGILTLFVQELGNLLGCVLFIKPAVAGITIVAFGTSVPDTFASRTAAVQDQNADAAIGNITGSNSVNVFLGLGLPWVITTTYRSFVDKELKMDENNLDFVVLLFTIFGSICIVLLVVRRKFIGGELGGPPLTKFGTSIFLVGLWTLYVVVASLRAYDII